MIANVYYVTLSDEDRIALNAQGWDGPVGRRYHDLKDGKVDFPREDPMVKMAATVEAPDAETIWSGLQNCAFAWSDKVGEERAGGFKVIACHTDFPRSMDVGDVIVWGGEGHEPERCADVGFEPAKLAS